MTRSIYFASKPLSEVEASSLKGTRLGAAHYDEVLVGEDVDVFKEDGNPLFVLRHRALPGPLCEEVLPALRRVARPSENRGGLRTGIVGYFDRGRSWRYCRVTPFTRDDRAGWRDVVGLFREVDRIYQDNLPAAYADQRRFVDLTHPDFVIPGTVFTTGTVNDTESFPTHQDAGNLHLGCSTMAVFRRGDYKGCLFVLPQYRIAVDLQDRDVVLFDSSAWHGNTPFEEVGGAYERISVVAYYRSGMIHCGSAAEEHERAKRSG